MLKAMIGTQGLANISIVAVGVPKWIQQAHKPTPNTPTSMDYTTAPVIVALIPTPRRRNEVLRGKACGVQGRKDQQQNGHQQNR